MNLRIQEFQRRLTKALGSSLEHATPANVREFVDQTQQELWREEHPRPAPTEKQQRIEITPAKETTYEEMMRGFFVSALYASRDDSLIQLWILALDLAYSGIEEMHAERMQNLFRSE
jgi:hypothetical protein